MENHPQNGVLQEAPTLTTLNQPVTGDRFQRYYFISTSAGQDTVHLRHNKRGNFLFADGHVSSLKKTDLINNYGDLVGGLNAFVDVNIDESNGGF